MGAPRLPSSSRDPNNLSCIPVRFEDKTQHKSWPLQNKAKGDRCIKTPADKEAFITLQLSFKGRERAIVNHAITRTVSMLGKPLRDGLECKRAFPNV